jgi:hypothetical protein
LAIVCVAGLAGSLPAAPKPKAADPKPTFENAIKQLEKATAVLAAVKDGDSAKTGRAKFDKVAKELLAEVQKAFKEKKPDNPTVQRFTKAASAFQKEVNRIDSNAKTSKAFRDHPLFPEKRRAQEFRARIDCEGLSTQVETYKLNNGVYPTKIEQLTQPQPNGSSALVPEDKVRDPWGQLYQIDPKGKNNKGRKADVFSLGHPLARNPFGNW